MTLAQEYPMSKRQARKERSRRRASERGQENAIKRGAATPKAANDPIPIRTGLDWLLQRRKITPLQVFAGRKYGRDYRRVLVADLEPLRSCLNDQVGGGGLGGFPLVQIDKEAQEDLQSARQALAFQTDLTAACDLICGRELTPWEVVKATGGTQRDAEQLLTTVRIALDILGEHYRGRG